MAGNSIDITIEEPLPTSQMAEKLGVSLSTIYRWINGKECDLDGHRVYLQVLYISGRMYTTMESYHRFVNAMNGHTPDDIHNHPCYSQVFRKRRKK